MNSVMECVNRIDNERTRSIVSMRLQGKLLKNIGKNLGITRERTRQIFQREMQKIRRSKVREDEYKYIFENYYFSEDVFTAIFNDWKELIRNTVKIAPAYVFIGGEKVARTKINLLTHCLKMSKLMTAKELWVKHNDFVHGCDLDEYKINTYHAFETIARRSYKIIFSSAQGFVNSFV